MEEKYRGDKKSKVFCFKTFNYFRWRKYLLVVMTEKLFDLISKTYIGIFHTKQRLENNYIILIISLLCIRIKPDELNNNIHIFWILTDT